MKRFILLTIALALSASALFARKITYSAVNTPAEKVFADLMKITGYNFSYDSSVLRGLKISVNASDASLDSVLSRIFADTPVTYSIRGRNVVLKRKPLPPREFLLSGTVTEQSSGETLIGALVRSSSGKVAVTNSAGHYSLSLSPGKNTVTVTYPGYAPSTAVITLAAPMSLDFTLLPLGIADRSLGEVTVTADRKAHIAMHSSDIGRLTLSSAEIAATPVLFGETDLIKSLHFQPGVTSGVEGLAAMYVHGGANDENLYMLDNVPVYQINHFGGLFSAFNTEAIKNVDFYKTSFPARYNGRLSSILSVNTRDGNSARRQGSLRLGLTSGAFNIEGPLFSSSTTYSLALRRSWFDALTVPALAIYNSRRSDKENTTIARYAFTDINAKITHRFSDRSRVHAMFYFGDDYLRGGDRNEWHGVGLICERRKADISRLKWGNIIGSLGWNLQLSSLLSGELTASVSRYRASLRNFTSLYTEYSGDISTSSRERTYENRNRITDLSLRADFSFNPASAGRFTFGAALTSHDFIPQDETSRLINADTLFSAQSVFRRIHALEGAAYLGYDTDLSRSLRLSVGVNTGFFHTGSPVRSHVDPRASVRWAVNDLTSLKFAYSRSSQYVHQLTESSLSLPTDRWVPVSESLRPQRADKIAAGFYRRLNKGFILSAEVYYKWFHNLIDYRDDYFLLPQQAPWQQLVCTGSGRARGFDLMVAREYGRISGHIAYSYLLTDRIFPQKNGGLRFPARFDNRHKINILLSWKINSRWEVNAGWTGMSGNRITLSLQDYQLLSAPGMPHIGSPGFSGVIDVNPSTNNFRLPFYHRLDIGVNRHTARGMWNFSLYNAYSYMNVISVRKVRYFDSNLFFPISSGYEKYRLIPVIPSVSYTWFF